MGDDLKEKFDALFPTWTTIVATIVATLVLLIVLTKFVYNPIKKMHDGRRKYIQNNINEAEKLNTEARQDRSVAGSEVTQARLHAAEILAQARLDAQEVRTSRAALATEEAHTIIEQAKFDIAAQQVKFEVESKKAIVDVALAAAAKIIEREVDTKTNRKVIEDYISGKHE